MASSNFQRQTPQVTGFHIKRVPDNTYNPLLSNQPSRLPINYDEYDSQSAEAEFLEQQRKEMESIYRAWLKFYVICSVVFAAFGTILGILWLRWGIMMNRDELTCINLKNQILLTSVIYLVGFLDQLVGILVAFLKVLAGLVVYGMFTMMILVTKVFIDTDTLNLASDALGGCARTAIKSLTGYVVATIVSDVLLVVLLALTGIVIYRLKKTEKAKRLLEEYRSKSQREVSGLQINI